MKYIVQFLDGKKTYTVALTIAVLVVLEYLGVLDPEPAVTLYGLLGASGLATLRLGYSKSKKK